MALGPRESCHKIYRLHAPSASDFHTHNHQAASFDVQELVILPLLAGIARVVCSPLVSKNLCRHRGSAKFANQILGRLCQPNWRSLPRPLLRPTQPPCLSSPRYWWGPRPQGRRGSGRSCRGAMSSSKPLMRTNSEKSEEFRPLSSDCGMPLASKMKLKDSLPSNFRKTLAFDCSHISQLCRGLMTMCCDGDTVRIDFGRGRDNVTRHVAPCFECGAQGVAEASKQNP